MKRTGFKRPGLPRARHARPELARPPDYTQPEAAEEQPKDPPARRRAYLTYVRAHDCCVCQKPGPSVAHHHGHGGGMAQKTDDFRCVPLCRTCHEAYHRGHAGDGFDNDVLMSQIDLLIEWLVVGRGG